MKPIAALTLGTWLWTSMASDSSFTALRVVIGGEPARPLLENGGFEQAEDNRPVHWQPASGGCQLAPGAGRQGSQALVAENSTDQMWTGASQTINLNQKQAAPLVVAGWSKAQNVSGGSDADYSLYVDLVYIDGTPLWGQTARFACGTHDYERRQVVILPEKPVKTLTLHCLLRGHSGKAWFDEVGVAEVQAPAGTVLFQGVPVHVPQAPPKPSGRTRVYATQDGLSLGVRGLRVTSLRVQRRELSLQAPAGFMARDLAAGSDFQAFAPEGSTPLELQLDAAFKAQPDHIAVRGKLTDLTGRDRAVTLVFALPLAAEGWSWGDDIRRQRTIEGHGEFAHTVAIGCGATGALSLYPVAPIWNDQHGLALALDMGQPAQYRLGYHAGLRQLFIAYDFALVPDTRRSPQSAAFAFVLYRFDSRWGFRSAFDKLTRIFPTYFQVRSVQQGLWMPFTDISTVERSEDFGFKYHEGNNNVPWDDAHGILSFRYTEPMTWWMTMPKEQPRTLEQAEQVRNELARATNTSPGRMAAVSLTSAMSDEQGRPSLLFRQEPWCQGAVWSLNPNPYLPGPLNAATIHWSPAIREQLYGESAQGRLDGEYLDSLEGYVTAELNFRREHFRESTAPLVFANGSLQPALYKGLAVYEFTRWIAEDLHQRGKLTFANGVPYRFTFLCPWLDVMGTETDWLRGGQYHPASHTQMCLWRTMAGQKPYLLLLNTDYEAFTPPLVERYFQRSLFYGMYPSMFSHNAAENPYWQNPKWYNRDRPLFRRYVPLIKLAAEAGWQPVTDATCDNPWLLVERFGPGGDGRLYLTVFNDSDQPQRGALRLDTATGKWPRQPQLRELVEGGTPPGQEATWQVSLPPHAARLYRVSR